MCLSTIIKNRKVSTKGYFYAIVRKGKFHTTTIYSQAFLRVGPIYLANKWYDARNTIAKQLVNKRNQISTFDMRYKYCPYFHLFVNIEDAKKLMRSYSLSLSCDTTIVKCKIRTIVACGKQSNVFVVVARYRKIIDN